MRIKCTIILLILFGFLWGCYSPKLNIVDSVKEEVEAKKRKCRLTYADYIPENEFDFSIPERTIKLHFYIIDNLKGTNNFDHKSGTEYIKKLIASANDKLRKNKSMRLPEGNSTEVLSIRIKYVLDEVSYHNEDKYWFFDHKDDRNNVMSSA